MKRIYIKVLVEFSPEGLTTPVKMEYDNRWFEIDRLVRVERKPCNGRIGIRYEVKVWGQTRYLFRELETDRWYVESDAAPLTGAVFLSQERDV